MINFPPWNYNVCMLLTSSSPMSMSGLRHFVTPHIKSSAIESPRFERSRFFRGLSNGAGCRDYRLEMSLEKYNYSSLHFFSFQN